MSYHLIDVVQRLGRPRILVLGDLILDRYIWGNADRISQEAPVILLCEQRQENRLGGAANVANMLRGLEAEVTMAGVVGADVDGQLIRQDLQAIGVDCAGLISDPARPTTLKQRYLGRVQHRHPHQMLRVDREVRTPLDADVTQALLESILPRVPEHQCVLISDYAKGVCTPEVLSRLIAASRDADVPVIVDPACSADYRHYSAATAITPNRLETSRATRRAIETPEDAIEAGRALCRQLKLKHVFVTLDSDGIALVRPNGPAELFPTRKREVYDITGAGDMVLAAIGIGAAAGVAPADLARLANIAGGLEVEQIGVVAISRKEILADLASGGRTSNDKICSADELQQQVAARKQARQRVVFTNGCFDLLHVGHVTSLEQAAREGDCLIVALNSDESVRRLNKAAGRPLFSQKHRATMLAALEAVDYVVVFNEPTPHLLLSHLKPDLLVKGGTYCPEEIVGREVVESYGGQVKALGVVPGVSTTEILRQLRSPADSPTVPISNEPSMRKAG